MRTPTGRWIAACVLAETIGMTAAAAASVVGSDLPVAWALAAVVAGGLVEGTALGLLQGRVLRTAFPRLRTSRYAVATVLVAGLGWAGASAPAVLSGDDGSPAPAMWLVLLGAAGIGLVMGPVLGLAQAIALRGAVRRPWRWVVANTTAWPAVMAVIFLGASTPEEGWPGASVIALGALTGAVAGALLGVITARWLAALGTRV